MNMNDVEFRAVLDWWMCSDPWVDGVPKDTIDAWLERESNARGYDGIIDAYHTHMRGVHIVNENGQFGAGA